MANTIDILSPADQEGTEATILRWLKQPGDAVKENEPLLELETDKVTVEIPAPASGRLQEILKKEKEDVEPGVVLGRLSTDAAASASPSSASTSATGANRPTMAVSRSELSSEAGAPFSPAVKRLLSEHRLDSKKISATGKGGRLTAQDITRYLEGQNTYAPATPLPAVPAAKPQPQTASVSLPSAPGSSRRIPHTQIRKRIAAHMASSMATAPHVTTVFEADLSRIVAHRAKHVKEFEKHGVKLTYTAYFVAASAQALMAVPEVNSRFHDEDLEVFADCNIGVGTALGNEGLIVPVIHRAQTLNLFGIAKKLGEMVASARAGQLVPDAVRGGTFTISNHGVSGSLFAAPIVINQPQVAILGVGKLERRVIVEEIDGADAIRVKPMCYVTLTIDHRALDAFQANAFLTKLVQVLQSWPDA